jgi:hypothetical protein
MSKISREWIRRLGLTGLALVVAVPCLGIGAFISLQVTSEVMAYALKPPDYPGSAMIGQWRSGGPDAMWDRRTYRVADSMDNVVGFYEAHLPGFNSIESESGISYGNYKCDKSWLSRVVARLINEGHYPEYTADNVPLPCVSVSIYPAPGNLQETQYEIWLEWPAN